MYEDLVENIQFNGERYSVKLPWSGTPDITCNYQLCVNRLKELKQRLNKDPEIAREYNEVIQEQLKEGIIEKVTEDQPNEKIHYLPHHPVVRKTAETTKLRIVFDASAKVRKDAPSLNDCLHVGPPLAPLMFDILVRFWEHNVALVGDIQKAFLQIEVNPEDRNYLGFLWVKNE